MEQKPLHIRVAEALGIVICNEWTVLDIDPWNGPTYRANCSHKSCVPSQRPPRYDIDWAATGPLIEKYRIDVLYHPEAGRFDWRAEYQGLDDRESPSTGQTPLIAVCNLIIALSESGNLK